MFPKKKKSKRYLTITTASNILYEGLFHSLPFPESVIIEKSIQFFDDPQPCFIHQSAVRSRLLLELEEELDSQPEKDGQINCLLNTLPLLSSYTKYPPAAFVSACYK